MEILFGIVTSACVGYMVTELNQLQKDVKDLQQEVTKLLIKIDRRQP